MGVAALGLIVFSAERTPLCFEVKHVEFLVAGHLMDQRCFNVKLSVGKGAVLLVFTLVKGLGTEFCFIFLDVVQALNLIMSKLAVVVAALLVGTKVNTVVVQSCATTLI